MLLLQHHFVKSFIFRTQPFSYKTTKRTAFTYKFVGFHVSEHKDHLESLLEHSKPVPHALQTLILLF